MAEEVIVDEIPVVFQEVYEQGLALVVVGETPYGRFRYTMGQHQKSLDPATGKPRYYSQVQMNLRHELGQQLGKKPVEDEAIGQPLKIGDMHKGFDGKKKRLK